MAGSDGEARRQSNAPGHDWCRGVSDQRRAHTRAVVLGGRLHCGGIPVRRAVDGTAARLVRPFACDLSASHAIGAGGREKIRRVSRPTASRIELPGLCQSDCVRIAGRAGGTDHPAVIRAREVRRCFHEPGRGGTRVSCPWTGRVLDGEHPGAGILRAGRYADADEDQCILPCAQSADRRGTCLVAEASRAGSGKHADIGLQRRAAAVCASQEIEEARTREIPNGFSCGVWRSVSVWRGRVWPLSALEQPARAPDASFETRRGVHPDDHSDADLLRACQLAKDQRDERTAGFSQRKTQARVTSTPFQTSPNASRKISALRAQPLSRMGPVTIAKRLNAITSTAFVDLSSGREGISAETNTGSKKDRNVHKKARAQREIIHDERGPNHMEVAMHRQGTSQLTRELTASAGWQKARRGLSTVFLVTAVAMTSIVAARAAPSLASVTPANGATNVPVNSTLVFVFDQDMDTSVDLLPSFPPFLVGNFEVTPATAIFLGAWEPDDRTLTCTPVSDLPANTMISWKLNPTGAPLPLTSASGQVLATVSGSFTTAGGGGGGQCDPS